MSVSETLPEGWEMVRLSDVGTFKGGSGFPLNAQGKTTGRYPFFKVSDFSNQGNERTLNRANHYIDESDRQRIGARVFQRGTIAFAKIGAAIFLERKRLIEQESCLDNNMAGYTLQNELVSRDLILANLQQFSLGSLVASTALPAIGSGELKGIAFPMPSSPHEQHAIAAALSDADGVVAGLERVIAKKRLIKQGAMQDLLTARRRLPGFSGEWEVKRLGELGEVSGSGVDKKLREDEQPVRLLNYTDVYRETYIRGTILDHWVTASEAKARRCSVRKGDVFFTPTSETPDDIARSAVAAEDIPNATYSYHVVRLRLKEQDNLDFWAHIFEIEPFRAQARQNADGSGTRYVVTLPKFRNMTVRIPDRKEREAIGEILRDMSIELEVLEARLAKARAVKEGMMQNLLTGRVRLA